MEAIERKLMLAELENINLKLELRMARRKSWILSFCLLCLVLGTVYFQFF